MQAKDKVFGASFLKVDGLRKNDIISRLNELHKKLHNLSQDDPPKGLKIIASQLAGDKILRHTDKDVRLLAGCCLVDIFRIFAPEAPFNDDEMVTIFELFIAQLAGIATNDFDSAIGEKIFYILQSLATVKTCVIPVMLAQSSVSGADELLLSMFETIISAVRADQPEEVTNHMTSILQYAIEESQELSQDILDVILHPLLPASKLDNPAAFRFVSTLIRSVKLVIQEPITKFINYVLVGSVANSEGQDESDLSEFIYSIIYELHKISPQLLVNVLPNVAVQLEAEEDVVRAKAVKLMGRLFSSPQASYEQEFHKNFKDFLRRFMDSCVDVRLAMIENGAMLMANKPDCIPAVEEAMAKRLTDQDPEVRLLTVTKLTAFALEDPLKLSVTTFQDIRDRARDKREDVRKQAVTGLAKIYVRHLASTLPPIVSFSEPEPEENIPPKENKKGGRSRGKGSDTKVKETAAPVSAEMTVSTAELFSLSSSVNGAYLERLKFVPTMIVNCWGYPDIPFKHTIVQLIQECILPKTVSKIIRSPGGKIVETEQTASPECEDHCRASALLLFFSLVQQSKLQGGFGTILAFKTKVRNELSNLLKARQDKAAELLSKRSSTHALFRRSNASELNASLNSDIVGADAEDPDFHIIRAIHGLTLLVPTPDNKAGGLLEKFLTAKDMTIFRLMKHATQPSDCISASLACREDLKQRLDSKSPLGNYCSMLFDFSGFMITNEGMVLGLLRYIDCLLESIASSSNSKSFEENCVDKLTDLETCGQLLLQISKHASQAFRTSSGHLNQWLLSISNHIQNLDKGGNDSSASPSSKAQQRNSLLLTTLLDSLALCVKTIRFAASSFMKQSDFVHLETSTIKLASSFDDILSCELFAETAARLSMLSFISSNAAANKEDDSPSVSNSLSQNSATDSLQACIAAVNKFSSVSSLSVTNSRLAEDLFALSALIKFTPGLNLTEDLRPGYVSLFESCIQPILTDTIAFFRSSILVPKFFVRSSSKGKGGVSQGIGNELKVLVGSLKVWTNLLVAQEELNQWNAALDGSSMIDQSTTFWTEADGQEIPEDLDELLSVLYSLLNKEDEMWEQFGISDEASVLFVRSAAAQCIFSLLPLRVVGSGMTVDQWKLLGWSLIDSDQDMRRDCLKALSTIIQTHVVHPRFLAYPCLLANDDKLKLAAEQALLFATKRLRVTHEQLCGRAMIEDDDSLRLLAEHNMPEVILPYVLYILSYSPGFPSSTTIESDADKIKLKSVVNSLKMVLNVLVSSLRNEADNLSYLLKQANTILQQYHDRMDAGNIGLLFVARLTVSLLSENIRTIENIENDPGEVRLPIDIYSLRKDMSGSKAEKKAFDAAIRRCLEGSENVMNQIVQTSVRSNKLKKAGVSSPTRASGGSFADEASKKVKKRSRAGSSGDSSSRPKSQKSTRKKSSEKVNEGDSDDSEAEPAAAVAVVRHSSRPVRSTRGEVNYSEKLESEKEMLHWEEEQAKESEEKKRRSGSRGPSLSPELSGMSSPIGKKNSSSLLQSVLASPETVSSLGEPSKFVSLNKKRKSDDGNIGAVSQPKKQVRGSTGNSKSAVPPPSAHSFSWDNETDEDEVTSLEPRRSKSTAKQGAGLRANKGKIEEELFSATSSPLTTTATATASQASVSSRSPNASSKSTNVAKSNKGSLGKPTKKVSTGSAANKIAPDSQEQEAAGEKTSAKQVKSRGKAVKETVIAEKENRKSGELKQASLMDKFVRRSARVA